MELELQTVMSLLVWVLGTELGSSAKENVLIAELSRLP